MGKYPRDEKDHINVKKNEQHRCDVEFNGVTGFTFGVCSQSTFIGRILDLTSGGSLPKNMARNQDADANAKCDKYLN